MTYNESLLLTGDAWNSLDDEEKIAVLQVIENHMAYESNRISSPVEGRFMYTGDDGVVMGSYDPATGRIYINTSQFDPNSLYGKDSSRIITTCLHEGRHAYQHQVAKGIVYHEDAEEAEKWKDNLREGNYISFNENPRGYYEQPVEADARAFAEERYKELLSERKHAEMSICNNERKARDIFEEQMNDTEEIDNSQVADYRERDSLFEERGIVS